MGCLCYSDVYRRESGRCCTLPFFLTFHLSRFFFYSRECVHWKMVEERHKHDKIGGLTRQEMSGERRHSNMQMEVDGVRCSWMYE